MLLIVGGGMVLSWPVGGFGAVQWMGPLAVVASCLCWAIDNNLTRQVSASDALFIASTKGLVAGTVNAFVALAMGARGPEMSSLVPTLLVGLLGYGVSLVMFVMALRGLGTARTGAYFSTAPFMGAVLALVLFGESLSIGGWAAFILMGLGVWLHLTEVHEHNHHHEAQVHSHAHSHDDGHHQHEHAADWDGRTPHEHSHQHLAMTHSHAHFPDTHHRHSH
jgi:drug/metabolite transporter (DMT)-like permease